MKSMKGRKEKGEHAQVQEERGIGWSSIGMWGDGRYKNVFTIITIIFLFATTKGGSVTQWSELGI